MPRAFQSTLLSLALVGVALPPPVLAQTGAADIVVNMRGVEIADVAEQISRLTGRTLILDPSVRGAVTVTSAEPLTSEGVWELFQSVLRAQGFAAVRSGRAWRIVPQANAVRDGGVPTRAASGQELVTRMIRLGNVPAADAARIVRPLVAQFGSVEPLTSPNAIVVTDYADNVRRVEAIARSLDGGGGSTFATVTLRNGVAADVAASVQAVLGDATGTRVAGDPRSNVVILRGTPAGVAEARRIVQSLDAPGGATPTTRVFRLSYADAEAVTEVLRGVLGQGDSASNAVARSLAGGSTTNRLGSLITGGGAVNTTDSSTASGAGVLTGTVGANPNVLTSLGGSATGSSTGVAAAGAARGFSTPELNVQPAPEINAVVVRGTPAAIAAIEPLVVELDVRRPQVLIEAAIAEITGDEAERLGVQLGSRAVALSQVEGIGTSFTQSGASLGAILTALGVPAGAVLGTGLNANIAIGNDFSLLIQALGTSTKSNLLSTPSITMLDNQIGEFVVGQNVPFVTGSILTNTGSATPYTTIERKDVGLTLRVLPRINAGDTIRLEIAQEASSIAQVTVSGAADLITNRRAINTTVLADNGQTIVLGGLISDDRISTRQQVPLLGDIPVLGELFRSRQETRTKRTLFIFLKPTILRDGAAASTAAGRQYDRLRGGEQTLRQPGTLLLYPPGPRLTLEIEGIY